MSLPFLPDNYTLIFVASYCQEILSFPSESFIRIVPLPQNLGGLSGHTRNKSQPNIPLGNWDDFQLTLGGALYVGGGVLYAGGGVTTDFVEEL